MSETFIVVCIVIGLFALAALFKGKRPPTASFTCARCQKQEIYSTRTIEAWRRGFKRIYCKSCHYLWLKKNSENIRPSISQSQRNSGCLGMILLLPIIPAATYSLWTYFS